MSDVQRSLIGKGIEFPDMIDDRVGDLSVAEYLDVINQSIYSILSTRKGERFMLPEFGSDLYKYVFHPNIYILQDLVSNEIQDSIKKWEPRISIRNIKVTQEESTLSAEIYYNLNNSNTTASYVYPINRGIYDMESNSNTEDIL